MKTTTALWCTAISLTINFNLLSQTVMPKEKSKDHVMSHVKPGMTEQQIDSLQEIAEHNSMQNEVELKSLLLAAQKANKNSNLLKTDNCTSQNWGFENGNTSNWQTTGCVELQNGGTDIYSGFSKVNNGDYSLKLSNDVNWNCLNSAAARTYSVPASGETFITIHFAVSIFNFPHSADYAGKFNFNLYDDDLNVLSCPTYQAYYSSDEGPVGIPSLQETPFPATFYNPFVAGDLWFNSNVSYSNWHHVTIDLSDYAGSDVTLVFQNRWCVFDVDWIYTYIDVDCPVNTSLPIPICAEGDVELCAPQGMSASYNWEFNENQIENSQSCITVDEIGTYTLNFMPTYLECANTPYALNFQVVDQPNAEVSVAEFCIGEPVIIQNLSEYATNYQWNYNGNEISSFVPIIDYVEGLDEIMLIAITGNCRDTVIVPLIAHKKPEPKFDFQNECVGAPYKIVNHSIDPDNSPLDVHWEIGTNYQSTNWTPSFTAENDASYVIALNVTNQYGCTAGIQAKAKAFPLPKAHFSQSENSLAENVAMVFFQDESSSDVTTWQWLVNNQNVYNGTDFYHEFEGEGTFSVVLIVENEHSCRDTADNEIEVKPTLTVYVPNTFTPNGDEHNHLFYPVFSGSNLDRKSYSFLIYNRWGEIVYQTTDLNEGWNGFYNSSPCIQGTYSWEISFKKVNKEKMEHLVGHVNLVR
jgi:gliding motility-associated-like protein